MKFRKLNQNGFAHLALVVGIVVAIAVGYAGYRILGQSHAMYVQGDGGTSKSYSFKLSSHDGVTAWGCRYNGGLYVKYVVTSVSTRYNKLELWNGGTAFDWTNKSTGTFYHSATIYSSSYRVAAGASRTAGDATNPRYTFSDITKCY